MNKNEKFYEGARLSWHDLCLTGLVVPAIVLWYANKSVDLSGLNMGDHELLPMILIHAFIIIGLVTTLRLLRQLRDPLYLLVWVLACVGIYYYRAPTSPPLSECLGDFVFMLGAVVIGFATTIFLRSQLQRRPYALAWIAWLLGGGVCPERPEVSEDDA